MLRRAEEHNVKTFELQQIEVSKISRSNIEETDSFTMYAVIARKYDVTVRFPRNLRRKLILREVFQISSNSEEH